MWASRSPCYPPRPSAVARANDAARLRNALTSCPRAWGVKVDTEVGTNWGYLLPERVAREPASSSTRSLGGHPARAREA
jgi:hypothetical protein